MAGADAAEKRRYVVLGPVEAHLDGRVLPVARGKQTLLLAALLARPDQVVTVDTLVDTLWGQRAPPGAAGTLRALMSKLRRALADGSSADSPAEGLLVSTGGGYRLRLRAGDTGGRAEELLDVWAFASLLEQARAARLAGQAAVAVEAYRSALGLWRGPAFAGATGHGDVGLLVTGEARRLELERAGGTEERLAAELDMGRHAQLLGDLEALVAGEPLHERPHELLMIALHRAGRQHEALAVYRRLRSLLAEELGVEPSVQMGALHQRILQQDPTLALGPPQQLPGTGPGERLPGNLPSRRGELLGRDAALAQTLDVLRVARVVTLTGTAGVGKTSLALHAAGKAIRAPAGVQGLSPRFPDGAWVVELAAVEDGKAVVDTVSSVLAVQRQGQVGLGRLVESLRWKRLLLVLDNCEHVIDAAAELAAAVADGCPHVVVLATSREPLGVDGEHVILVPPLAVPSPSATEAGAVRLAAAAALFLARAEAAAPGFALSDSNAAAIGEICRRLDGVPLAIELAATRMRSLSPGEVVDRLERRFQLLRSGPRTAGTRHRTLQAAIDWSYGLLSQDERLLFDRLSVFAGGFALSAAERVAADGDTTPGMRRGSSLDEASVAALLGGLVDKSMVVAEPVDGSTRYALLETLRAYGRERLASRGEEHATRRAHAAYLTSFAEAAAGRMAGHESLRCAEAITQELDELRAGHAWALVHDLGVAVRVVAALFRYVEHRLSPEVPVWAEHTVAAAEDAGSEQDPLLPTVYAVAARGAARRGDLDRAKVLGGRGTEAAAGPENPARRHPLYALAVVALFEGRLQDASRLGAAVERLSLAADDAWFAVRAQTVRTLARVYAGDLAGALAVADDARARADRSGDPAAIGWSRYATGEALLESEPERAAILLEEALAAARSVDERYLTGVAMVSVTSVRARHGDARQAASLFGDVIEHWHAGGNWTQQWTTIRNVVELLVRAGGHRPAAALLGALDRSGSAPPAFGTGAARMAAARSALADRLGPALAEETARGAAMDAEQVLRFTRSTLHRMVAQAAGCP